MNILGQNLGHMEIRHGNNINTYIFINSETEIYNYLKVIEQLGWREG